MGTVENGGILKFDNMAYDEYLGQSIRHTGRLATTILWRIRDTFQTSQSFYGQDTQKTADIRSCATEPSDYKCEICKLENEVYEALGSLQSVTHYISRMYTKPYFGEDYIIDAFDVVIEAQTNHLDFSKILSVYKETLNSFDGSYVFMQKPDFTRDLTEVSILGNFDPVFWERKKIESSLQSSVAPSDCQEDPKLCSDTLTTELKKIFNTSDCLMNDSIIENVQETLGITIKAEFDLKAYFRRIPTASPDENRIINLFEQKMKACGLTQCTDQGIFAATDFLIWKCGDDNENCEISSIPDSRTEEKILLQERLETNDLNRKQSRVQFRVEIFTDLSSVEDIQINFIEGMNKGKSDMLDFESWPISNALFKSSNLENLEKFQTSLIIPTVVEVTETRVKLLIQEIEKLICGEDSIDGIYFCHVDNEQLKVSGFNVECVVDIFSNLGLRQTEEILTSNYNSHLKIEIEFENFSIIALDKLKPDAIRLVQILPRNFNSGLSSNEIVMISIFSVFGSLVTASLIIIFIFYYRFGVIEIFGFLITVMCYIAFCLAIFYGVRGDLDWAASGSIVGISVTVPCLFFGVLFLLKRKNTQKIDLIDVKEFEDLTVTKSSALEIPTEKSSSNDEVRILPPIRNLNSQYSHTE